INPITGYPQRGVVSATVIAPDAATADALSTALCVWDAQKGLSLIDSLGDSFAAMIIVCFDDLSIIKYESRQYRRLKQKSAN
ncbi:MAG: FAD:protein FMN transferase, partial [Candidatus Omnitrophota bacterium]